MRPEVLRSRRLPAGRLLMAIGLAVLIAGCISGLALDAIKGTPHSGFTPLLDKRKHAKRDLDCVDCHKGAKKKAKAGMPTRGDCMDCHEDMEEDEEQLPKGGKVFDEQGKPRWKVVTKLPKGMTFSHAKHTKKHECKECHGDVGGGEYDLVDLAAKYENCRRCHQEAAKAGRCTQCHEDIRRDMKPHSHDSRWGRTHGRSIARAGRRFARDNTCNKCHDRQECSECHTKTKPRDHTVLWDRAAHGFMADLDRGRCATCHTEDRCIRCHLSHTQPLPNTVEHVPTPSSCDLCHGNLKAHVVFSDNCLFCHRP